MHKFYVFKNARVKKRENIMFTEKDLRCDGSELRYGEAIFTTITNAIDKGSEVELIVKDKQGLIDMDKNSSNILSELDKFTVASYDGNVVKLLGGKIPILLDKALLDFFSVVVITQQVVPVVEKVNIDEVLFDDEVDQLIQSRSNGTYNEIADDAGDIISILEDDMRFNYFFAQIANKLARIKHRYSVEDSLLDIAGYAKLELERLRNEKDQ